MVNLLKNVFDRKNKTNSGKASDETETLPLSGLESKHANASIKSYEPAQLICASAQSVGKQREHNEDTLLTFCTGISDGYTQLPFGVFVIADGMGGHQYGEVASSVAAKKFAEVITKKIYLPAVLGTKKPGEKVFEDIVISALDEAHKIVQEQAPGGGTTLTGIIIWGNKITVGHVGDSRAYLLQQDGRLNAITKDHSLVGRLVELGQITEKEATLHPQRSILLRAIGQADPFYPDVFTKEFSPLSTLIICSDGLWSVVTEQELHRIVKGNKSLQDICRELVDAANTKGGPDNISVILVKYLH